MARKRATVWRYIKRTLLALVVFFTGLQLWYGAQVLWLLDHNPSMTSYMEIGLARLQRSKPNAVLTHQFIPYKNISEHAKRAVIGAEDSKFANHIGFDVEGIRYAIKKNLRAGEKVAGGSTITQQLAKNLFLTGSRSYGRKVQEAIITLQLEVLLSKERILELYLNYAEWGSGLYGIESAARYYYGTSAGQLNSWQAARLAAMLPKPRYYQHVGSTEWLEQKTAIVQRRMPKVILPQN